MDNEPTLENLSKMTSPQRETFWKDRERDQTKVRQQVQAGLAPKLTDTEKDLQHHQAQLERRKRSGESAGIYTEKITELRKQVSIEKQRAEFEASSETQITLGIFEDGFERISSREPTSEHLIQLEVARELFLRGDDGSEPLFATISSVTIELDDRDRALSAELTAAADDREHELLEAQLEVKNMKVRAAELNVPLEPEQE